MRAEVANIALQFLRRVDIKGAEAETMFVAQQEAAAIAQGHVIMQPVAVEPVMPGVLPAPRTRAQVDLEALRKEYDEYKAAESKRIETLLQGYIAKLWTDTSADFGQLNNVFGENRVSAAFKEHSISDCIAASPSDE